MSFNISLALESNSISNPVFNSILDSASNSISSFLNFKSILFSKQIYIFRLVSIITDALSTMLQLLGEESEEAS